MKQRHLAIVVAGLVAGCERAPTFTLSAAEHADALKTVASLQSVDGASHPPGLQDAHVR